MLTSAALEELLAAGRETRGLEFKTAGLRTDAHFFAKVARAALSMGNLRDGGHIVLGIHDSDPAAMLPGLDQQQLTSWTAYDDVSRKLAEYAAPALDFDLTILTLSAGTQVVCIEVREFSDVPHLCAKEYPKMLRPGALYVRPRKVPETSEVASVVEMRELLDLATEKALRAYVGTASRAGVSLGPSVSDDEQYAAEMQAGWS